MKFYSTIRTWISMLSGPSMNAIIAEFMIAPIKFDHLIFFIFRTYRAYFTWNLTVSIFVLFLNKYHVWFDLRHTESHVNWLFHLCLPTTLNSSRFLPELWQGWRYFSLCDIVRARSNSHLSNLLTESLNWTYYLIITTFFACYLWVFFNYNIW